MTSNADKFWRWNNPVLWGGVASAALVIPHLWLAFAPFCETYLPRVVFCRPKWRVFMDAAPNEIGDTLAGFAGALAFIWVIVTVALQSTQLRYQRVELQATREEIKQQREATEDMARSLQLQAEIFEFEHRERQQSSAYAEATALVDEIVSVLKSREFCSMRWVFVREGRAPILLDLVDNASSFIELSDRAQILEEAARKIRRVHEKLIDQQKRGHLTRKHVSPDVLSRIFSNIEQISRIEGRTSPANVVALRSLRLEDLRAAIEEVFDYPQYHLYWTDSETP